LDCKELHELFSGYLDHELDPVRSLEVEQHLNDCVICSEKLKVQQALSNIVAGTALYHTAPAALEERVRARLRRVDAKAQKSFPIRWQWLAYAASIAFVFLLGWMIGQSRLSLWSDSSLTQELASSHVRSLMPGHLTDVLSTDQHTVKPWFTGKLDFSPPVKDLSAQGFPLIGGRIDYVNHKTVAVLVYKRHQHIINLYLWSSPDAAKKEPGVAMLQGYNMIGWVDSGVIYHAVSDLNGTELREFVSLLEKQE